MDIVVGDISDFCNDRIGKKIIGDVDGSVEMVEELIDGDNDSIYFG